MQALTPDERRGALLVVALLLIGAAHDAWRTFAPGPRRGAAPSIRASAPELPIVQDPARMAPGGASRAAADTAAPAAGLDLNRAGEVELDALPGIGPVLARRIVEHRRQHGPFRNVDELRAVRGVGPRLLERLRGRVRVSS